MDCFWRDHVCWCVILVPFLCCISVIRFRGNSPIQWNANGIGNKQTELSIFLEAHNVKVAAIQESKLTAKSISPNIQNYTLVRHDRRQGPREGLLFFIHNSVSFTRKSLLTTSKNHPHLEELTISIAMDNTEFLITNVYIRRVVPAMGVIHHQSTTC